MEPYKLSGWIAVIMLGLTGAALALAGWLVWRLIRYWLAA